MASYKFIFFKLNGCVPCTKFYNSGVWDRLKSDKALLAKIIFEIQEIKTENGKVVGTDQFYINKAITSNSGYPFFYLQKKDNKTVGYIYKQARSFDQMKAWLLSVINTTTPATTTPTTKISNIPTLYNKNNNNNNNNKMYQDPTLPTINNKTYPGDKYEAIRIIHRNIMRNGLKKSENNTTSNVSSASTHIKPTLPNVDRHAISSLPIPVTIPTDSITSTTPPTNSESIKQTMSTSSISNQSEITTFKPNNYPSLLYENNIKRPPSNTHRPYHPLYASNPDTDKSNEDNKDIVSFKFKSLKR